MTALLERHQKALEALCRRYHVKRLEVFGSATGGDFDPETSDIDFIVEFEPGHPIGPWLAEYFDLKEALEALFGRSVDLVMSEAVQNPYFKQHVERQRRVVYAD